MFTATVDTKPLEAAFAEFAREARKDLATVIRQQAGILTGHMIALTPPAAGRGQMMSDRGGIALSAKKAGESAVAADISALFPTTKLAEGKVWGMIDAGFEWGTGRGKKTIRDYAPTEADMARIHRASRNKRGRVTLGGRSGANMALTRAAVRRSYIKKMQKRVGLLNAGWLNAADELKTSKSATPAWIRRHGSKPGGADTMKTRDGLAVRIYNRQPYFPKDMNARTARAVRQRTIGLLKATQAMVERRAAKANARMNR